eukprot:486802-Lingulodinium_polyedra.AAC.1
MSGAKEVHIEEPEGEAYEYNYYSVIVPSVPVRKIKRSRVCKAEHEQIVVDGEQAEFGPGTTARVQQDLLSQFNPCLGVGPTLDGIFQLPGRQHLPLQGATAPATAPALAQLRPAH